MYLMHYFLLALFLKKKLKKKEKPRCHYHKMAKSRIILKIILNYYVKNLHIK